MYALRSLVFSNLRLAMFICASWFCVEIKKKKSKTNSNTGADLGFSRGGGFSRIYRFFLGRPNWFFRALQALKSPCFGQKFCTAGKILKKQAKKGVLRQFLESSSKLVYQITSSKLVFFCTEGASRKILGSISQKEVSQSHKRGTLWVGGGRIRWCPNTKFLPIFNGRIKIKKMHGDSIFSIKFYNKIVNDILHSKSKFLYYSSKLDTTLMSSTNPCCQILKALLSNSDLDCLKFIHKEDPIRRSVIRYL